MLGAYKTYIQLCFFRGSARYASASTATLFLVCGLFALTSFIRFQLSPNAIDPLNYYGQILVVFSVFNVLIFLALVYRKTQDRYRKVLSTFVGTRTLIDGFMILVLVVAPTDEYLRLILMTAIAIWRMCIVGYILKEALNVMLPIGVLISIAFTIISIEIANLSVGNPSLPEVDPTSE